MVKKYEIVEWIKSESSIVTPITKFGGQPIWIEDTQWPVSKGWEDRLMIFVGQIAIAKGMFGNKNDLMAYIFVTHANSNVDDFFDPDVLEWGSGESAVIIQPGGKNDIINISINKGPSLFNKYNMKEEYIPIINETYDPEFLNQSEYCNLNESQRNEYFNKVDTNKIGGVPNFFRGDEWPEGDWILLFQLKCSFLPFDLRLGDMPVMYVFISKDFEKGGLLIQD